ncbi:MAG TPA: NAD(P)-binding domain-containing protein [Acidimicrobiales bacterium]
MTTHDLRHIAVFGAGAMSRAVAPHWARPGRVLTVSGRTPATAEKLAAELGAEVVPWRAAAEAADVVFLGVHWAGVDDALTAAGADDGTLAGKVIIDCGNPVEVERFTLVHPERSLTTMVEDRTGARVVKAFNLCHAEVWRRAPRYAGRAVPVPLAGDDEAAKELVAALVAETGAAPVDVGGREQAVHLEAAAAVIIRLLFGGADPTTTFTLTTATPGPA